MTTVLGKDYALIDAGDVVGLQNAISAAGSNPTSPYNIFLQTGTYSLSSTLVIFGMVRIYGTGVNNTIIQQGQRDPNQMAGVFTLNGTLSELQLHNLTVKDGIANAPQYSAIDGAGVKVWAGTLIVEDCKFDNNLAGGNGGAIANVGGKVQAKRTLFSGNRANSGAAIHTSNNQNPALTLDYCRFTLNAATVDGGAVYVAQNPGITISNSSFLADNTAPAGAHIRNNDDLHLVNAQRNKWYPSPQVIAVDTSNPLSTDPTATMPVVSPEQKMIDLLFSYGITAYLNGSPTTGKAWTLAELRQVVIGIQYTARAFNLLKYGQASGGTLQAKTLFQAVMGTFYILRVQNGFLLPAGDLCNGSVNIACTSNANNVIVFYGNVIVDSYTLVHELGHRFDNRSNQPVNGVQKNSLSERLGAGGAVITDCDNHRVLGELGSDGQWERGDRGWGSAYPGNFQKNALKEPGKTSAEIGEATGDMFLNWVYRRNTDSPAPADACAGSVSLDGPWEGFKNVDWSTGQQDSTKPGTRRYKWMEDNMLSMFNDHPSWV